MRKDKKEPAKLAFHLPPKPAKRKEEAEQTVEKPDARALLKKALARHDLHVSGAEAVTDKAQAKLREDLQAALDALEADDQVEA